MFKLLEHIKPDLILLDVEMPDMNGYEATRALKKNEMFKDIPIIFLTARGDPVSEKFGLNLGATDYIHKPIVSDQLLKRIEKLFALN
jgi:DNA-binding response OmpR family regulator